MAATSPYINKIKVNGEVYNIGMDNAVHYHGAVTVPSTSEGTFNEFYSDSACTSKLTGAQYQTASYIYTNTASLTTPAITKIVVGCMVTLGTHEFVVTEMSGTTATWSQMGEVKTTSATITTSVTPSTATAITDIDASAKTPVVTATNAAVKKAVDIVSADTKDVTVVTANVETATVKNASAKVVTAGNVATAVPVTNVSIKTAGSVTPTNTTAVKDVTMTGGLAFKATPVSQTVITSVTDGITVNTSGVAAVTSVSGGVVDPKDGTVTEVTSVDTATLTYATGLTGNTGSVVTKVEKDITASTLATMVQVDESNNCLTFNFTTVVTEAVSTASNMVSTAAYDLSNIAVATDNQTIVSSVGTASKTVITAVDQSDLSIDTATVVTNVTKDGTVTGGEGAGIKYVDDGYESLNTYLSATKGEVLESVAYTDPTLDPQTASYTYVASVNSTDIKYVDPADSTITTIVTAVPVGTQNIVESVSISNDMIVTADAVGTTEVITAVSASGTTTVITAIENNEGTVITAAM